MFLKNSFKKLPFFLQKVYFKLQVILFKKIVTSKNAWLIFDHCNLPGFGTNLQRTYFPIYYDESKERNSFSEQVSDLMIKTLQSNNYHEMEENIALEIPDLCNLPTIEKNSILPYLDNYFFGILDAAALGAIIKKFKPAKIVEIGSGISTRYMKLFCKKYSMSSQIVCIDPFPRVEIAQVADQIINMPLEQAVMENVIELTANDILFMDGSHYVFQGNDTLLFFFNLLPSLPSGVVIHVHDIYLPYDYEKGVSQHLWAEQYLLATMLIAGLKEYRILYPSFYQSKKSGFMIETLEEVTQQLENKHFEKNISHKRGYSFWMQKL